MDTSQLENAAPVALALQDYGWHLCAFTHSCLPYGDLTKQQRGPPEALSEGCLAAYGANLLGGSWPMCGARPAARCGRRDRGPQRRSRAHPATMWIKLLLRQILATRRLRQVRSVPSTRAFRETLFCPGSDVAQAQATPSSCCSCVQAPMKLRHSSQPSARLSMALSRTAQTAGAACLQSGCASKLDSNNTLLLSRTSGEASVKINCLHWQSSSSKMTHKRSCTAPAGPVQPGPNTPACAPSCP